MVKYFNAALNGGTFVYKACKKVEQQTCILDHRCFDAILNSMLTSRTSRALGSNFEIMTQFVDLCRTKNTQRQNLYSVGFAHRIIIKLFVIGAKDT